MSEPARFPDEQLARRFERRICTRHPTWRLLSGMLLGADACAVRCGRDESRVGSGAHCLHLHRKIRASRPPTRTNFRRRDHSLWSPLDFLRPSVIELTHTHVFTGMIVLDSIGNAKVCGCSQVAALEDDALWKDDTGM